jgi:hypothetical protein
MPNRFVTKQPKKPSARPSSAPRTILSLRKPAAKGAGACGFATLRLAPGRPLTAIFPGKSRRLGEDGDESAAAGPGIGQRRSGGGIARRPAGLRLGW